jgi:hypothetical protein
MQLIVSVTPTPDNMKMNRPLNQSPPLKTRLALIVGALAVVAAVISSQAQSVFSDDFESYADQAAFDASWTPRTTAMLLSTAQKHSGTNSILQDATALKSVKPLSAHVTSENLYLSCWFRDGSGGNSARSFITVEGRATDGDYTSSLVQLVAIGRYNNITGSKYYGREANGSGGGTSEGATAMTATWFQLGGAANKSTGWHRAEIAGVRMPDLSIKYRFYIDGVLGGACTDAGGNRDFNFVACGSFSTSTDTTYFDDVKVESLTMVPQIDTSPTDVTVNELQNATFTVAASAGGTLNTYALNTLKYQWQRYDDLTAAYTNIPSATASSYSIPVTHAADAGSYQAVVTDAYGRLPATSAAATLTVTAIASPVIDSQTGGGIVNVGGSATFTVTAHGTPTLTYTWKRNGSQVATGTASSYSINPVAAADAGTYTCVVHNDSPPDATSADMVLTVNLPPTLAAPPATVPVAAKLEIGVGASSTPALSATGTMVQDFEAYGAGSLVMFAQPSFSGTTSANLDLDTGQNATIVADVYPAGHLSPRVLKSSWTWNGTGAGTLRFTTSGTQVGHRPIISYTNRLRFDICSDRSLKVALGVRDTSPTGAIGTTDPATSGQIEWVGVTTSPTPDRTVAAGTWTTLDFNPATDPVKNAWGVGNGVLDSTTGKGALEDLYLVTVDGLPNANNVYLDNFIVLAAHPITFTLGTVTGPATGATIDQYTGKITWTPTALGPVTFQVTATDDYGLSSTQTFTVTVVPSPARITSITYSAGDVTISGSGAALQNFRLKSSSDLTTPMSGWTTEETDTTKTGSFNWTLLNPDKQYFRVESYGD